MIIDEVGLDGNVNLRPVWSGFVLTVKGEFV